MASIARNLREGQRLGPLFYARFAGQAFGMKEMKLSTRCGPFYIRPSDTDAGTLSQVFVGRAYDLSKYPAQRERLWKAYQTMLAAGETPMIVDAGANVGAAARWFAAEYPKAKIIAVEPDPATAAICRKNLNMLPDAEVVEAAIGSKPGNVTLRSTGESWGTQTIRSAETEGVPVVTVPMLRDKAGPKARLLIVKVDIEGFEKDLFEENTDWVSDTPGIMIEPHDWMLPLGGTSRSLRKVFAGQDHDLLIGGDDTLIFIR